MSAAAPAPVVMLVSFAEVLGGAERSLLTLATQLPARGFAPLVVAPPGELSEAATQAGVDVERLSIRRAGPVSRRRRGRKTYSLGALARRSVATVENAVRLVRLAHRIGPAVLHSNSLPSHLSVALAGRLTGRPALWHLREIVEPGPGRVFLSGYGRLATGMVAISDAVASTVSHRAVHTIVNPVHPPPPDVTPASWDVPRPRVGYLGRLDRRKGIEDLLMAMQTVNAHVVVVGKPYAGTTGYVASLRQLAADQAPGRVHFVGAVDNPWQALAGMDVLVVPSLAEPFGRVAAEGQRAGVPVVAADAGGLREIVNDGHDGLLFRPGDPDDLARCLRRLLADDELRARLGAAGVHSGVRFDPARHADAMAEVFAEHLATFARSEGARRPSRR